jgi:aminoglycoside phosphotransferase (APT) family kinase protein
VSETPPETVPVAQENTLAVSIDVVSLARWLDSHGLTGDGETVSCSLLSGGTQNELYLVTRGPTEWVLRMAARPVTSNRTNTMRREFQILQALSRTDVPHARFVGGSLDSADLGAPFYLMEKAEGWSPGQRPSWPHQFADPSLRSSLGLELVGGAAALARVDWQELGLDGFGRPEGFHERQVPRWLSYLSEFQFRELPGLDEVASWLSTHIPKQWAPGLMHGDYQFVNVMFDDAFPAQLSAIIDWEMATIGDPLLDLGWAMMNWPGPDGEPVGLNSLDLHGMPTRRDALDCYEAQARRTTEYFDYYVCLARFKLAIVLEASVARRRAGALDNRTADYDRYVIDLLTHATEFVRAHR